MPKCLLLTPFPLSMPKHGGQIRAASMLRAAQKAGWSVHPIGIFPAAFFPAEEWGANDIVLDSPVLRERALGDMAFADLHVARWAATENGVVKQLRDRIARIAPDVIQIEHPWSWLVLREALPEGHGIPIVYSSHNLECAAREPLLKIGLQSSTSKAMLEATRLLEESLIRRADLVLSISDVEGEEIARIGARPVLHLPAVSDLAASASPSSSRFAKEARVLSCRYAALMGSAYWPNVEGFFSLFPEGLGFLERGEQIWVAGTLAQAVRDDERFKIFESINESRSRMVGYVEDAEKAAFFEAASCVIVPVQIGAGSKLKTADAVVSGRPVVATSHALEGYGRAIQPALGKGIYVADTPKQFRSFIRQALRGELQGCDREVREALQTDALTRQWDEAMRGVLKQRTPAV